MQCNDPYEENERYMHGQVWTKADKLSHTPPRGWIIATRYSLPVEQIQDVGVWLICLENAQEWTRESGRLQHVLCRDDHDARVLLVDPARGNDLDDLLLEIEQRIESCDCGGMDCLFGDAQAKAARVFAKRRWETFSFHERLNVLEIEELPQDIALDDINEAIYRGGDYLAYAITHAQ